MYYIYFDTSALIKRYTPEIGSDLLNKIFYHVAQEYMVCSILGVTEIISILVRKRNDGRLTKEMYNQALINFNAEVVGNYRFRKASALNSFVIASIPLIHNHNINATDAIILRSALEFQQSLATTADTVAFCAADKRLLRAASNEGLSVFNPEEDTFERLQQLLGIGTLPT